MRYPEDTALSPPAFYVNANTFIMVMKLRPCNKAKAVIKQTEVPYSQQQMPGLLQITWVVAMVSVA